MEKQIFSMYAGYAATLCHVVMMGLISLSTIDAAPPPSASGVWSRGGEDAAVEKYPFERGVAVDASWADVEEQPGVYDWSSMDP